MRELDPRVRNLHLAGAAYWGEVAAWHLKALQHAYSDVRAAKAEALAELAARHALVVLGREDEPDHEGT